MLKKDSRAVVNGRLAKYSSVDRRNKPAKGRILRESLMAKAQQSSVG